MRLSASRVDASTARHAAAAAATVLMALVGRSVLTRVRGVGGMLQPLSAVLLLATGGYIVYYDRGVRFVDENTSRLSQLLHQVAETHHQVFAITDGEDPDWATWYADWLVNLSPLSELVGTKPVRSELTYMLVGLDKEYVQTRPPERWEDFYAVRLMQHLSTAAR